MKATQSKNRVLVMNTHIALVGGSCALADFHVVPLGSNMTGEPPESSAPPNCYMLSNYGVQSEVEADHGVKEVCELDGKLWPLILRCG